MPSGFSPTCEFTGPDTAFLPCSVTRAFGPQSWLVCLCLSPAHAAGRSSDETASWKPSMIAATSSRYPSEHSSIFYCPCCCHSLCCILNYYVLPRLATSIPGSSHYCTHSQKLKHMREMSYQAVNTVSPHPLPVGQGKGNVRNFEQGFCMDVLQCGEAKLQLSHHSG